MYTIAVLTSKDFIGGRCKGIDSDDLLPQITKKAKPVCERAQIVITEDGLVLKGAGILPNDELENLTFGLIECKKWDESYPTMLQ